MCHWSSHEYERRLGADPTRSFFQALRDLFRRKPQPRVEAPKADAPLAAPVGAPVGAQVIPLRAGRERGLPARERADAA